MNRKLLLFLIILTFLGFALFFLLKKYPQEREKPVAPSSPTSVQKEETEPQWFERDITNMELMKDDRACEPVVYRAVLGEVFDGFLAEMEEEDHTQYWYQVRGIVKDIYRDEKGQTYLLLENSPNPLSIKVAKPDISELSRIKGFEELPLVKIGDKVTIDLVAGCEENKQLWLKTYTFGKL